MSYLTWHMQDPFNDWNKHLAEAYAAGSPFKAIKSFHPENYGEAQAASPGIKYIFRYYIEKVNQGAWIEQAGQSPGEADAAADTFILSFRDSVNQHMGNGPANTRFAESLNEEYPTANPTKLRNIVEFDRGFVRRLGVWCPGVKPVVFCAAIGNPDHNEYGPLVPLAKEVAAAGGAFGYHAYAGVRDGKDWIESAQHQLDLHMRWHEIDLFLISQGVRVNWFLGEGGPIICNPDGYGLADHPGWKDGAVYGGNKEAYVDYCRRLDSVLAASLAAKEGRLWALALFTNPGGSSIWSTFEVPTYEVAQYIKATPNPVPGPLFDTTIPDPGPDPTPPPDLPPSGYKIVVNLLPQDATLSEKFAVAENRHTSKETFCQSADDAGKLVASGKDGSFVRVYGAERWGDDIVAYLSLNYGVEVVTADFPKV